MKKQGMDMKCADEFGKLESFGMNLLSQMGIAGLEEQKTLQAAVLKIQKNWKEQEKKLPEQKGAHFYRYSTRESGVLYGEDGIRIKQNLTGKKPMYLVSLSSPRTEFAKAIMAYTDSAYYHVSVSLQAGLGNLYSFMSPAAAGGTWEPGGGFCSDSIKRYRAEGFHPCELRFPVRERLQGSPGHAVGTDGASGRDAVRLSRTGSLHYR